MMVTTSGEDSNKNLLGDSTWEQVAQKKSQSLKKK